MLQAFVRVLIIGAAVTTGAAAMTSGGTGAAHPVALQALGGIEPGQWELRERDSKAPPRRICIENPAQLLQVQHPGPACPRFVVSDTAKRAVITYQCADHGGGRTDLRLETSRLVQLYTQGISGGAPFAMSLEGRRVGDCE